jgi:hypothetical protein
VHREDDDRKATIVDALRAAEAGHCDLALT